MEKKIIEITSNFAIILEDTFTKQKSMHVTKLFKNGDVISKFNIGTVSSIPTYLTIQKSANEHITIDPIYLQFTNHSCSPNVFFDTTKLELVALKDLEIDEELKFFYPSSEWNMTQSFECNCGSQNCLQNIKGAAHISIEILANYRLTDFIQSMLNK